MNIEALLQESEGTSLDFKSQQYRFHGASDQDKGELLKDILAFANAFRRTDAVILIGVQEVDGSSAKVLGVSEHIDDASLQQFVNAKTNVPVQFSYQQHTVHGKSVGVIVIPRQQRPIYAKSTYGMVRSGVVYYRQGSSTAEATPELIAKMGVSDIEAFGRGGPPRLQLQTVDLSTRRAVSPPLSFSVKACPPLDLNSIDDYVADDTSAFGLRLHMPFPTNRDYWRDLATYIRTRWLARPIGFAVENISGVNAENVRVSFEISRDTGLEVFEELPDGPSTTWNPAIGVRPLAQGPSTSVEKFADHWSISVSLGSIQPRMRVWASRPVFIGATRSGAFSLPLSISADNLPEPSVVLLETQFEVQPEEPLTQNRLEEIWYELESREWASEDGPNSDDA